MIGLSRGSRTTLAFCACAAILNVPRLHNTRAVPRANATVIILMPCLLATHSLDPTRTSGDVRLRAAVVGIVQARLDRNPDKMRARRQTVEHPFGTIQPQTSPFLHSLDPLRNSRAGDRLGFTKQRGTST